MRFSSLHIAEERDIVVSPLLSGSGKTKLLLPDIARAGAFRQRRTLGAEIELFEIVPGQAPVTAKRSIEEPVIYAGPLFHHFGHFIAESTQRLWPRLACPEHEAKKVAFHCAPIRRRYMIHIPAWMATTFDYLGLPLDDIIMIDEPILFRNLHMPDQARCLGRASPDPAYADLFPRPAGVTVADGSRKRIYVSRQKYLHSGSYLGETLVEEVLARNGFHVIHPEAENVVDVIKMFGNAEVIVFSEGSAIHILELCGRVKAKVFVICRRKVHGVEIMFAPLLAELAAAYEIYGSDVQVTPLDWHPTKHGPSWIYASSRLDLGDLLQAIGAFAGIAIDAPPAAELEKGVQLDLLRVILDKRHTRPHTNPQQLHKLLQMLRDQAEALKLMPK